MTPKTGLAIAVGLLVALPLAQSMSAFTWEIETVDAPGWVGVDPAISVDLCGDPHISYHDSDNKDLKYATKMGGGSWDIQTVDSGGSVGRYSSITAEQTCSNPRISYYDATNGALKYAAMLGTSWSTKTLVAGNVGWYTSIAWPSNTYISYYDYTNRDLGRCFVKGGDGEFGWECVAIDTVGDVGRYSSIAVDSSGRPHISYYDLTNGSLKYHIDGMAPGTADPTGVWWGGSGDPANVGRFSSLALDSSGMPHISYFDDTNTHLKYATKTTPGTWFRQTVDTGDYAGMYTSIAVDSSGSPHISYIDYFNKSVKYARKVGGSWIIETVEVSSEFGYAGTSIALDLSGKPHIAYYDIYNRDLKYAHGF